MSDLHDLGDLSDLDEGEMRTFPDLGEFGIVVCRVEGELRAVIDNCSHADRRLSEGRLRGPMLICPLHGAQFDVRDGSHQGPPAWEGIACYRVDECDGTTTVDLTPPERDSTNSDVGGRFRTR